MEQQVISQEKVNLEDYVPYPGSVGDIVLCFDAMIRDGHEGYLREKGVNLGQMQARIGLELDSMRLQETFCKNCMMLNGADADREAAIREEMARIMHREDEIYSAKKRGWVDDGNGAMQVYTPKELKDFARNIWGGMVYTTETGRMQEIYGNALAEARREIA